MKQWEYYTQVNCVDKVPKIVDDNTLDCNGPYAFAGLDAKGLNI